MPQRPAAVRFFIGGQRFAFRYRRVIAVVVHLGLAWLSNAFAFLLRFDGRVPASAWVVQLEALPLLLMMRVGGFVAFDQFRGLTRNASFYDLRALVLAVASSAAGFYLLVHVLLGMSGYPQSIVFIDGLVLIALLSGLRLGRRAYNEWRFQPHGKKVLIVGAGQAGALIVRDMLYNPDYDYQPVGFVDDDPQKQRERIHGVPVLGKCSDLARVIGEEQPDEVLIAMPSAPAAIVQEVVRTLQPFHVNIATLPNLRQIVSCQVAVEQIRKLAIEDLLERPPVGLDPAPVRELVAGRRVMVTGAGGSIGSELCRQIAAYEPGALLLFERYENTLHDITNELETRWPDLDIHPVIGDIGDLSGLTAVFSRNRPQIVFHAAAHKHVPLMELNPLEAVKNNVFGTMQMAAVSAEFGVERFILISTDKAVNPSSAMGVTKHVAELVVQAKNQSSSTVFAVVRFGNVLASNGSVVPRFIAQIRAGGPVTVTHPEMRRFFMLIPEAVLLVTHAAAMAKGGEVFILDMGEQMKVVDMARTLIHLSGFVPDQDIPIAFIGTRPGEKLYEELVGNDESIEPSGVEKISRILRGQRVETDVLGLPLAELKRCTEERDLEGVRRALQELVPTFAPDPATWAR